MTASTAQQRAHRLHTKTQRHPHNAKGPLVALLYALFVVVGPCIVSNVCIAAMIKNFSDAQEEALQEVGLRISE